MLGRSQVRALGRGSNDTMGTRREFVGSSSKVSGACREFVGSLPRCIGGSLEDDRDLLRVRRRLSWATVVLPMSTVVLPPPCFQGAFDDSTIDKAIVPLVHRIYGKV
ncbi:hypothetical protein BHE74_00014396 [Ensete ventricosum]|nr:hypothetical protein BHE74_00014396 [Ensete ventricosum]